MIDPSILIVLQLHVIKPSPVDGSAWKRNVFFLVSSGVLSPLCNGQTVGLVQDPRCCQIFSSINRHVQITLEGDVMERFVLV
jgi:hypothetical protein